MLPTDDHPHQAVLFIDGHSTWQVMEVGVSIDGDH